MTYPEARKQFKEMYPHYRAEAKDDYCKMQEIWSAFVDGLCRDGQITQYQYYTWQAPFQK